MNAVNSTSAPQIRLGNEQTLPLVSVRLYGRPAVPNEHHQHHVSSAIVREPCCLTRYIIIYTSLKWVDNTTPSRPYGTHSTVNRTLKTGRDGLEERCSTSGTLKKVVKTGREAINLPQLGITWI